MRDTGIGIRPSCCRASSICSCRATRSLDRSQGGLGIGLTLVRRLVELHGGTRRGASDGPGRGSEFVVRLPLAPAGRDAGGAPRRRARRRPAPAAPLRVLVVDDNVDAATGARSMLLELLGHEVEARPRRPGGAGRRPAQLRPDVVLLDIGLPGMDGYEVARAAARRAGRDSAALVALTGYGQDEDLRRSRDAGFDHHLVKPVDRRRVAAIVGGASSACRGMTLRRSPRVSPQTGEEEDQVLSQAGEGDPSASFERVG